MEIADNKTRLLKILFKELATHTISQIAKQTGLTRVGSWKILKKLEKEQLILLTKVGEGKTSTYQISLNWNNSLLEKTLSLALAKESIANQRWLNNLSKLNDKVDFLILYGSILHSPKKANDIDIMAVVSKKDKFMDIDKAISDIQKTQDKNIHAVNLTEQELIAELKKPNPAFIDAIKKGIILFGQEKFIKFVGEMQAK